MPTASPPGRENRHPVGNHRPPQSEAAPDESRVLIAADAEARHKQVLGVLNAVREAGVEKVSFETKNPNP